MNTVNAGQRFRRWFLGRFFYLLYNPLAWSYDLVAAVVSLGMWRWWIQSLLPILRIRPGEGTVLELGHGPGHLLQELHTRGWQVIGLDASRNMSRLAAGNLRPLSKRPLLIQGDARAIPLATSSMAAIVATFPSEYITAEETLRETARVLRPDGELLILPFAWITGTDVLHRMAAWLFGITEETPRQYKNVLEDRFIHPLQLAGYTVQSKMIELKDSRVIVLIARLRV
jgi:ubiquinone/menaquinone biosynthesis C-methylase UbiE